MSLLKTIKAQFGKSNTPANNFVLDASADNGTMKLARGNAGATTQDILTVDAAGKVVFPQNAQTLQDVKASRVAGTTYTNSTGQTITVMASMSSTVDTASINGIVGGLFVRGSEASITGVPSSITLAVPSGSTYSLSMNNGTTTILTWVELR